MVFPRSCPLSEAAQQLNYSVSIAPPMLAKHWLWVRPHENHDVFDDALLTQLIQSLKDLLIPSMGLLQPDFIVSQTIASPWGSVCAELMNIRHVLCPREYGRSEHNVNFSYQRAPSLMAMCKSSDQLFCVTDDVCQHLFEERGMQKNISTYHSIQLDRTYAHSALDCIDTASWCIAQLGSITEGKGQLDLIRAVIALSRKGYFLRCYFVGSVADQKYKELLDRTISESGFCNRFVFMPNTLHPYPIISALDVLVSCARFEGLGRTLFEAILLDVPIVYVNSGGPAVVFKNDVHGLSYESGDFLHLAEALRLSLTRNFSTNERVVAAKNYVESCFTDTTFGGVVYNRLVHLLVLDEPLSRGAEMPVLTLLMSNVGAT